MGAAVLQNKMPNTISERTRWPLTTCGVCGAGVSRLSGTGFPQFGSRRSARQVQISSITARVKDAPLSLGAGQCWAETAGNHMTKTVETFHEGVLTNAWTGSQLGQRVFFFNYVGSKIKRIVKSFYAIIKKSWKRLKAAFVRAQLSRLFLQALLFIIFF